MFFKRLLTILCEQVSDERRCRTHTHTHHRRAMSASNDTSLHSLLDSLGGHSAPPPAAAPIFGDLISAANAALDPSRPDLHVPLLLDSGPVAARASLAVALRAVATLGRAWGAAKQLRAEADVAAAAALDGRRQLEATVARLKAAEGRREREVRALNADVDEARRAVEREERRRVREVEEVCGRLTAAQRREAALGIEGRRREIEYGKLQERVHSMLANRSAVAAPVVRIVEAYDGEGWDTEGGYGRGEEGEGGTEEDFEAMVESGSGGRQAALLDENEEMRSVLRVVQVELDGLVSSETVARIPPARRAREDNGEEVSSDVSADVDESGTSEEGEREEKDDEGSGDDAITPLSAPTPDQMELPFAMLREDFEESLHQKFAILRASLRQSAA